MNAPKSTMNDALKRRYPPCPLSCWDKLRVKQIYSGYLRGLDVEQIQEDMDLNHHLKFDAQSINDIIDQMNELHI